MSAIAICLVLISPSAFALTSSYVSRNSKNIEGLEAAPQKPQEALQPVPDLRPEVVQTDPKATTTTHPPFSGTPSFPSNNVPGPPHDISADYMIDFNLANTEQTILGVGANVFTDSRDVLFRPLGDPAGSGLGISWVRWWISPTNTALSTASLSPEAGFNAYYSYWQNNFNISEAQAQNAIYAKYGVIKIATIGRAPMSWTTTKFNTLIAGDEAATAIYAAAGLKYMHDNGVDIDYIEYFNEPDGTWDTHLTPAQVDTFSSVLEQEITGLGLSTQVLAAGYSHMDQSTGDPYVAALAPSTIAGLGAVSDHAYAWSNPTNLVSYYAPHIEFYTQFIRSLTSKPIFATEFDASKSGPYHGITYNPTPATCYANTTSDTGTCGWLQPSYGARLFGYLLNLFNAGISVPIVWWGYEYDWGANNAGQLVGLVSAPSRGSNPRPSFYMLQTLFPKIAQGGFKVVNPLTALDEIGIHTAAFVSGSTVIVSMVNDGDTDETVALTLDGMDALQFQSADIYDGGLCNGKLCKQPFIIVNDHTWSVRLPVDAVVTATFSLESNLKRRALTE